MATETTALIKVVEGQIVRGEEFQLALGRLRSDAQRLVVKDHDTCTRALEIVKRGEDEISMVIAVAEPEKIALQRRLDDLRSQRDKIVAEFKEIIAPLEKAARDWNLSEVEATAKEESKINAHKKPEQRVSVSANIARVPGKKFRVNYRVKVVNAAKVKPAFKSPDLQQIGRKARRDKNPEKTMREVGGILVTKE